MYRHWKRRLSPLVTVWTVAGYSSTVGGSLGSICIESNVQYCTVVYIAKCTVVYRVHIMQTDL